MSTTLIVTADPDLRDELHRLAAAAGSTPHTVPDPASALRAWPSAGLVLVGADAAAGLAGVAPPRRDAVHVVGWSGGGDRVYRDALDLGAEGVVELPAAEPWLIELLTDVGEQAGRGRVVGVVGGAGGAGATTLSCALGQVAGRSGPALLVDTDPLGPGADRALGLELAEGVRWEVLGRTAGRLGSRSLREAVPRRDGLGLLTWSAGPRAPLTPGTVREALSAARRGHDVVVIDLARQDSLLDELAARCDHLLVVAPATVAGVAATARVLERLPGPGSRHLAVRRGGVPPDDVARATGVPVLLEVPEQRRLAESVDLGLGPVRSARAPLARAVREALAVVAA
jgi:secretion/DNA translocation related CpaE-like protein